MMLTKKEENKRLQEEEFACSYHKKNDELFWSKEINND